MNNNSIVVCNECKEKVSVTSVVRTFDANGECAFVCHDCNVDINGGIWCPIYEVFCDMDDNDCEGCQEEE